MQALGAVTPADLRSPVQRMRYKLEVYDGAAWQNLRSLGGKDYVKSISVSLGGAGMSPDPIAGTWSTTLDNELGIFHPFHPTSPYAGLLRIGREIRISVGANYGGVSYYWRRIIGFMDAPRFDHGSKTVDIGGMDYMKLLADTELRSTDIISESGSGSGSGATDDIINGPTHWGRRARFDAVASPGGDGNELYDEGDACEIGGGEADNVANWTPDIPTTVTSEDLVPAYPSNWALQLERGTPGPDEETAHNSNVANVTDGKQYRVTFWARIVSGEHFGRMVIYQTVGATPVQIGYVPFGDSDWQQYSIIVSITSAGNMQVGVKSLGKFALAGDLLQVDNISIQLYDIADWMRYELPPCCDGPYFVTLDGEPVGQGDQEDGGWHYIEETKALYFSEKMTINAGIDNLHIYYYCYQVVENVLADIFVWCGLYADRATALADINYEPTGISLKSVWFESGSSALSAVKMLCERVNYRFWFAFDGRPCFKPAPVADAVDFSFTEVGHLENLSDFQDIDNVRNRVVIEGIERAMYQVTREDKAHDRYSHEVYDTPSILAYLEKTLTIKNHLFQDQASIDAMCADLLAEYKDPKWYADIALAFNPVPLELGDVIEWPVEFAPVPADGDESGGIVVSLMGIIRDIKLNDGKANYKVEIVDELVSGSASGSASASASASGLPGSLTIETFAASQAWAAPSGFDGDAVIETWAAGGEGGSSADFISGGGGAGGGAYSKKTVHVEAGINYSIQIGDALNRTKTNRDTYFRNDDTATVLVLAAGGDDSSNDIGATGGNTLDGIGDTKYSGGNGADQLDGDGGGGGGAAGSAGAGKNGAFSAGGAATTEYGGPGGNGGIYGGNGSVPTTPYGGGGGGAGAGKKAGAIGRSGFCRITYYG